MPVMNFWQKLVVSVAKIKDYEELIKLPTGKAITYSLLLTFIVCLLVSIRLVFVWNGEVDIMAREFEKNAPEFVFADGKLTVNAPMPYLIYKTADEIMIVDTSGKTNQTVLQGYKEGMLIGKSSIIHKKNAVETETYDLSCFAGLTLTKSSTVQYIPWLKWFSILVIIGLLIYEIIANLFAALCLSVFGLIAGGIMNYRILFSDLYKISIYALTLPIILELAKMLSGLGIPYFKVGFYVISIVYVLMVLLSLKKNAAEDAAAPVQ